MTLSLLFWILMLLWLVLGVWAAWPRTDWKLGVNSALPFFLFMVLGWAVFGAPIKG